jgi:integrase
LPYFSDSFCQVFTRDELNLAFETLPDATHIHHKLATTLMIHGGLRRDEVTNLTWGDIKRYDDHLAVTVQKSKTDQKGEGFTFFAMANLENSDLCPLRLFDLYAERIKTVDRLEDSRFFRILRLTKDKTTGTFTKQATGHSFFDKLGQEMAMAAGLPNAGSQFPKS